MYWAKIVELGPDLALGKQQMVPRSTKMRTIILAHAHNQPVSQSTCFSSSNSGNL